MTAALLLQVAAKVTVVLAATWGATRAMGRCSAAARHLVWVLAIGAALAVPAMHLFGPPLTLNVLPSTVTEVPVFVPVPDADPAPLPLETRAPLVSDAPIAPEAESDDPLSAADAVLPAPFDWPLTFVRVWLAGMAFVVLRLMVGIGWASWIAHRAERVTDDAWLDIFEDAIASLGVRARVSLRRSDDTTVPMATGLLRPAVLLPPSADDWSPERRMVVLQHELAHIKRRDCLVQALAQVACAIHWFNPITHFAVARLRAEQERACDDLVIEAGTDARTYADQLFEIARAYRATAFPAWATMSMARPSQLEGRVVAILDGDRPRRVPSRWTRTAVTSAVASAVLPFGALQLAAQVPMPPRGEVTVSESFSVGATRQADRSDWADDGAAHDSRSGHDDARDADLASTVEESVASFADAIPSIGFDASRLLALAAPSFWQKDGTDRLKLDTDLTELKHLGPADWKGIVVDRVAQSQVQGAPVTDETRRRVADALMIALGDDNADVREEALSALAEMRDERAIPGLIKALSDPSANVRVRALGALVQFETPAAAEGLLTAIRDQSPEVREHAARHLGAFVSRGMLSDPKYVDAFSALLKDANADVREQGVVALGRLRTPAAEAPLTQALKDAAPDVRQQAARALGQLRSADAVPALIALLKDPARDVRMQAAIALGVIADPRAIDPLSAALKDTDADVREQAARALGQVARGQRRGPRAVPVPPLPPRPPSVRLDIDPQEIRERAQEAAERAQESAERMQRDIERSLRDFDFDLIAPPDPPPGPVPAPAPRPGR